MMLLALSLVAQGVVSLAGANLTASARAGLPIAFSDVLDARFDPERSSEFEQLAAWAERPTDEELAQFYVQDPGEKFGFRERTPCWEADTKGHARAMVVAAREPTRQQAQQTWDRVDAAYHQGQALERDARRTVSDSASARPTQLGRDLALPAALDQAWREAKNGQDFNGSESEVSLWRFWSRLCHLSADNATMLAQKVKTEGWPLISRDGAEAAHDAFLIVQHADDDLPFQQRMLAIIEPLVASKEVDGPQYAGLFDRVALASGNPQRFGTQFGAGAAGCAVARPIEDAEHVDERRTAVGLPPLEEYAAKLSEMYKVPVCEDLINHSSVK